MTGQTTVDAAIVGAGFAGLAAAQVLGRAQRSVTVLGSGPTRNAEAEHAHNVLTRDGTPPGELIRLARAEVDRLPTVSLQEAHVTAVQAGGDDQWRVLLADGTKVNAHHVLIATGARDRLPEVAGLRDLWGRRAHSCPFCDGEAYAGRRILILAEAMQAAHMQSLLSGWTDRLTTVDPASVTVLAEADGDVVAHLTDGTTIAADGVFVGAQPMPRLDAVADLPLGRRGPYLAVDSEGWTGLAGLWAAGDCSWRDGSGAPGGQVIAAMAAGARAAFLIIFDRLGVKPPDAPPVVPAS